MTPTNKGLQRGRALAAGAKTLPQRLQAAFRDCLKLHPTLGDLDLAAAIRDFDRQRLAHEPSLDKFPELRGHSDRLRAERQAFRDASGLDDTAVAFQFSWPFFISRRVGSRHLARYDLMPAQKACTNVFFPFGADGVTLSDNRDDVPNPVYAKTIPQHRPEGLLLQKRIHWVQGGVSAACLLDDEPNCLFPANPFEYDLMPREALDSIDDMMEFGTRYREFFGPGNMIWVDRQLRAVAVEKSNCLVAFRRPTVNGAIAVTACAYLDESLHAQQMAGDRRAMRIKGETEATSPDFCYHRGSRERYRRLVALADAEAARPGGATLWGALEVVNDHAVPFPARVCLAGEKGMPDKEPNANWSLTQHAAVVTGPRRRCLYRSIQDYHPPRPIYEYTPKLMLGPGVKMRPEWQADIKAGRCRLAKPAAAKA